MQRKIIPGMGPQDIEVLLKIRLEEGKPWTRVSLVKALFMSQSEISESLARPAMRGCYMKKAERWPGNHLWI